MVNQNGKLEYNEKLIDDLAKTLSWGELMKLSIRYSNDKEGLDEYLQNMLYLNEINRDRINNIVEEDIPIPEGIDVEKESQLFNGELKRKIRI